jgi:hypothetical protein
MLSYANIEEAKADREVLRNFLRALDAPKRSLRRDECGSWYIKGHKGHVYTSAPSGGWLIFCDGQSPRKWSAIKRRFLQAHAGW